MSLVPRQLREPTYFTRTTRNVRRTAAGHINGGRWLNMYTSHLAFHTNPLHNNSPHPSPSRPAHTKRKIPRGEHGRRPKIINIFSSPSQTPPQAHRQVDPGKEPTMKVKHHQQHIFLSITTSPEHTFTSIRGIDNEGQTSIITHLHVRVTKREALRAPEAEHHLTERNPVPDAVLGEVQESLGDGKLVFDISAPLFVCFVVPSGFYFHTKEKDREQGTDGIYLDGSIATQIDEERGRSRTPHHHHHHRRNSSGRGQLVLTVLYLSLPKVKARHLLRV